jgi:hypothetical protein
MVDTLVMSNLAYFQLKAAPGRWLLSLAPGRTRDLYTLDPSSLTSEAVAAAAPTKTSSSSSEVAAATDGREEDLYSTQVIISSLSGEDTDRARGLQECYPMLFAWPRQDTLPEMTDTVGFCRGSIPSSSM